MAQYQTDFSEYTAGVQPSDWTERFDAGNTTFTVQESADAGVTGGKVLRINKTTASERAALSWDDIDVDADRANVEVLFKFKHDEFEDIDIHGMVRGAGSAGSETAYTSGVRFAGGATNNVRLIKYLSGTLTSMTEDSPPSRLDNQWYWTRLRVNGTTLQVKVWEDGNNEPGTWTGTTTDADISAAGWVGLFAFNLLGDGMVVDVFGVGTNGDTAPGFVAPTPADLNVIFMGQSQARQLFVSLDGGGSGGADAFEAELATLSGQTVEAFNAAVGGTGMSDTAAGVNGYWWDTGTDQASTLLVDTMAATVSALGDGVPTCIVIAAGSADANVMDDAGGTTKAEYIDSFQKVIAYARTQLGDATLPVIVVDIPRNSDFTNTGGGQTVREAHDDLVSADANMFFGADIYDGPKVDATHATDAGCVLIAEKWAASVAAFVLGTAGAVGRGPRATGAAIVAADKIEVTMTYPSGGSDFTAGADQFRVTNDGSEVAITGVTRLSATKAEIALGADLDASAETLVYPVYDRLQGLGTGAKTFIAGTDDNAMSLQSLPVLTGIPAAAAKGVSGVIHSGVSRGAGVSTTRGVSV